MWGKVGKVLEKKNTLVVDSILCPGVKELKKEQAWDWDGQTWKVMTAPVLLGSVYFVVLYKEERL
jgi:hypothetical protein